MINKQREEIEIALLRSALLEANLGGQLGQLTCHTVQAAYDECIGKLKSVRDISFSLYLNIKCTYTNGSAKQGLFVIAGISLKPGSL